MPQPFNNAVMTNAGARLLTRAQAGEIKIEFTRIATGNGTYSAPEKTLASLQARTSLKTQKNSYPLSDIDIFNDYSVKVTALITNKDPITGQILVTQGYYINEMGLFAKEKDGADSTEILYSIAVTTGDNGDFMPPFNGYHPAHIIQEYYATVSNSAEVIIQTGMGAAILDEDYQKLKAAVGILRMDEGLGFAEGIGSDNIIGAINEVFTLGSERKTQLVANLTAMGIDASEDDTWDALLDKILDMTDTSSDTVTAEALLSGYTAHDSEGEQITGEMPDRRGTTIDAAAVMQDGEHTYLSLPEGAACYDANSKVRAMNSDIFDAIYDAIVDIGVTPSGNDIDGLISGIKSVYNKGLTDGKSNVNFTRNVYLHLSNGDNNSGTGRGTGTARISYNAETNTLSLDSNGYVRTTAPKNSTVWADAYLSL